MHINDAGRSEIDHYLRNNLAVADHHHRVYNELAQALDSLRPAHALWLIDGHA